MSLWRLGGLALIVVIGVSAGIVTWHALSEWREGPGPKLRRDCASLVDTVLADEQTVSRPALEAELARRGVKVPSFPKDPKVPDSNADRKKWLFQEGEYGEHAAAMKRYDAMWEEIRRNPAYQSAWDVVFAKKRDEAIKECVANRARREGVSIE